MGPGLPGPPWPTPQATSSAYRPQPANHGDGRRRRHTVAPAASERRALRGHFLQGRGRLGCWPGGSPSFRSGARPTGCRRRLVTQASNPAVSAQQCQMIGVGCPLVERPGDIEHDQSLPDPSRPCVCGHLVYFSGKRWCCMRSCWVGRAACWPPGWTSSASGAGALRRYVAYRGQIPPT